MVMGKHELSIFLREVSNWDWREFCEAEHDSKYTSNQSVVFSLVRSCVEQELPAIRLSINRLDGKLITPVQVQYPKVFYIFPQAKVLATSSGKPKVLPAGKETAVEVADKKVLTEEDLPTMTFRETLAEMGDCPRELPERLVLTAQEVEWALRDGAVMPRGIPRVKSVVAAHLLIMAQNKDLAALTEVFDQLDGKLVDIIQVLGEDMYITSYVSVAPEGAELNADGVYQIEATQTQNTWVQKLGGVV
jgi:hypothetical protein